MKFVSKYFSLLILLSLFFSGCAEKNIEISKKEVERIPLNLSEPNALKMKNVGFYIITEDNATAVFKRLKAENKEPVLIGLSSDDYINTSENLNNIKFYIIEQRQIIKSYKEYYETNTPVNLTKQNSK